MMNVITPTELEELRRQQESSPVKREVLDRLTDPLLFGLDMNVLAKADKYAEQEWEKYKRQLLLGL